MPLTIQNNEATSQVYSNLHTSNLHTDHRLLAKYIARTELQSFLKKKLRRKAEDLPPGHEFVCPISLELMQEPVTTKDGFTFDLEGIRAWLKIDKTNPLTRQPLTEEQLKKNTTLKDKISSWIKEEIEETAFTEQGGKKRTFEQYQIIHSKLLKADPTISFKRTTQGIPTDLLVKYHTEIFSENDSSESTEDRNKILARYESLGMIKLDSTWCPDGTFCKNQTDTFEKNFLSNSDLPIKDRLKFLEVKNLLIYQHPNYDIDLIQTLKSNINDPDEIKIQKLVSFYLSETAQNIWWAQTGYRHQALINKYKPILTENILKTITLNPTRWTAFVISDALKLIIFCPERAGAYVNFQDDPSLENINQVINSGLVFALIAILLEHGISIGLFNYHISSKYAEFFKNPSITTWCNLIKENPGLIGCLSVSLGYPMTRLLKAMINWECHYSTIMSGNIKEAGQVFAEHPSLLGLLALSLKELGYNPHANAEYSALLNNPSVDTWYRLVKANPGLIGGSFSSLFYFSNTVARKIFIDPTGMKIPLFKFLTEDQFTALKNCNILTDALRTRNRQLSNLNEIEKSNYLDIYLDEESYKEDLMDDLRKIDIKFPHLYSNIFSLYWTNPTPKNRNNLFFKGGLLAAGMTVLYKNVHSCTGNVMSFFRPSIIVERNTPQPNESCTSLTVK